jgi:5-methyltetrahydrofolate--homocysteine methyltransferase
VCSSDLESPDVILKQGMVQAMEQIGIKFKSGDIYIPEVLIAARAMHAGMDILKPILTKSMISLAGKIVIGTVKGDLHDIGKNIVIMMLEGGGFEVIDLGVNVAPELFVKTVKEKNANVVALSALLTTTMPSMRTTIDALEQAGVRQQVKVLIGGAPITQKYANEIGADGYSDNAAEAVSLAKKCLGK